MSDNQQNPNSNNDKPADAADRPDWLPEKFKSPADLVKSYSELEKKLGSPEKKQEGKAAADEATAGVPETSKAELPSDKAVDSVETKIADIEKMAAEKQIDLAALSKEWNDNNGVFSEETLARLARAGVSKDILDVGVSLFKDKNQIEADKLRTEHLKALKMSNEELSDLVNWTANMSEEDRAQYTELVESNDAAKQRLGLKFAKLQRESVEGKAPKYVEGRTAPMESGYLSAAEVRADMADSRYTTGDPAFHAAVDAKLARSNREAWKDR